MVEIGETIVRDRYPCSTHGRGIKAKSYPAPVLRMVLPSVAQVSVSSGQRRKQAELASFSVFDK